jgi:D-glycerate 3-kinase
MKTVVSRSAGVGRHDTERLSALQKAVAEKIRALRLPTGFARTVQTSYREVADGLVARKGQAEVPLCVGICGSQGSGKSTMTAFLKLLLEFENYPTAIVSLDGLYLPKRQREKLARDVHPLLRARGVPGTHDVKLGVETLQRLQKASARSRTPLPAFDKAQDDRAPRGDWEVFSGRPAFILFEGWCVDARPQPVTALRRPINRLERDCDPNGVWRRYVNAQLADPYRELFAPIDVLIFMQASSFDCVYKWRGLQEKKLRAYAKKGRAVMDKRKLETFIMHYERLTRWMLKDMPKRADILLPLAPDQHIRAVKIRDSK